MEVSDYDKKMYYCYHTNFTYTFKDLKAYNLHREIEHKGAGLLHETNPAHSNRLSRYFK